MSEPENIETLLEKFNYLQIGKKIETKMNATDLKVLVESAVSGALEAQKLDFERKLSDAVKNLTVTQNKPEVEIFKEIEIVEGHRCEECLDIVKSLPEFEGKQGTYVSWRQAVHSAYKVFEKYDGSSRHYQAVGIIRNKIRGPADAVLASFNTVLNFKAIIARLDFTYADVRPIYLIEQELSTLRQGNLTVLEYYDEIEKKLTLLTNKANMSYDSALAIAFNEKYRRDALRVFISGLKKPLSDVLFSARPSDMPTALALAQEVEANNERYLFAASYAKNSEEKSLRSEIKRSPNRYQNNNNSNNFNYNSQINKQGKNPYFNKRQSYENDKQLELNSSKVPSSREKMDVDPTSSRLRQFNSYQHQNSNDTYDQGQEQRNKRPSSFQRQSGQRRQRVNYLQENPPRNNEGDYEATAALQVDEVEAEVHDFDYVNFLGEAPNYRLFKKQ